MRCNECEHRKWEEGDHSESPPGWGVYYCDLTTSGCLDEDEGKGKVEPKNCPLERKE